MEVAEEGAFKHGVVGFTQLLTIPFAVASCQSVCVSSRSACMLDWALNTKYHLSVCLACLSVLLTRH